LSSLSSRIPSTADVPQFLFLLTAREEHIWLDRLTAGNKLGPEAAGTARRRLALLCARRPPGPVLAAPKAAKVASFYSGANTLSSRFLAEYPKLRPVPMDVIVISAANAAGILVEAGLRTLAGQLLMMLEGTAVTLR
jgi:hypothetical protein